MIAIFCATPYQIFTAVNMKMGMLRDKETDLYIVGNFSNAEDICNRLRSKKIFSDVRLMKIYDYNALDKRSRSYRLWKRFVKYVNKEDELCKYVNLEGKRYNNIYYASRNQFTDYVIHHFNKINKNLKISVFEDGLGEYMNADSRKPSGLKRIAYRMLGLPNKIYEYDELWLYRPEACSKIKDYKKIKKINTDSFVENDTRDILLEVFQYDDQINERFIIFEQDYSVELDAFKNIIELLGPGDIIVKPHPRKETGLKVGANIFINKNVPWEIICMSQSMQDKVLISINSAACFTPKLIFDQEPVVILLYKIFPTGYPEDEPNMDNMVLKLKEIYRDKQRIMLPLSIESMNEELTALKHAENRY